MLRIHLFTKQKPCLTTIKNIFIANADTSQNLPPSFRIYYLTANVQIWSFLHTRISSEDFTHMFLTSTLKQRNVVSADPNVIL